MGGIHVHGMSLRPQAFGRPEVFNAFYSVGCLIAYAKVHGEGMLRDRFVFEPITPLFPAEALAALEQGDASTPRVFLLSNYVWNHRVNLDFAREAKRLCPNSLVIVGGPHVPRQPAACERYLREHPAVDIAARHEGEITLAEILETLARTGFDPGGPRRGQFSHVRGIGFLDRDGSLVRTEDRPRARDLAPFPSPYLTGEFDHWLDGGHYMPVETNRGCPYGCTFCDWGAATLSKIHKMSLERVLGEIEYAGKHRVHVLGYCDANFGILPRDLDIARHIVATHERYGYPKDVGYTNAKTANPRLTEIVKLLWDAGLIAAGQISMQTTDQGVLDIVERTNIRTSEYEKMIHFLHRNDIPAVSDMMIGLPGQSVEVCRKDLQFFFDRKVKAVIFATSVMPNAPMNDDDYRARYRIETDDQGLVASTFSFDREHYARMFELCVTYKLLVKLGLAKYLLYFLQVEHGVKALDLVTAWMERAAADSARYPISHAVWTQLLDRNYQGGLKDWLVLSWNDEQGARVFEHLPEFYAELLDCCARQFGVAPAGDDLAAVLAAQEAVMPRKGRALPCALELRHDVPGYFAALRPLGSLAAPERRIVPLREYGPGRLELRAQPPCESYTFGDIDLVAGRLELESNLRI